MANESKEPAQPQATAPKSQLDDDKDTKKGGCLDTFTKISVAIIGGVFLLFGTVLGVVLERNTDIIDIIFDPPRRLITDFSGPLSVNTGVTRRFNTADFCESADGALVIRNEASTDFHQCRLTLDANVSEPLNGANIGAIDVQFRPSDANELEESYVFLEMVTFFEHARLEAHCGIRHSENRTTGFMSVVMVITGDVSQVICPPGADTDPSDGRCETFYETVTDLTPDQVHNFRLRVNPASHNEFQCFINGDDKEFWVNTGAANLESDLSKKDFERYIVASYTTGSTVTYTADNLHEIR